MQCRQCGRPIGFGPFRKESLSRCRQFAGLAAVLGLLAAALWGMGVAIWPWWVGAAALFVLSQALLKWQDCRWVICDHCGAAYSHFGGAGPGQGGGH